MYSYWTRSFRKIKAPTDGISGIVFLRKFLDILDILDILIMRAALYARVSTKDQNSIPMQMKAMRSLVRQRNWEVTMAIKEIGSGASERPERETILTAARARRIDVVIVWKTDRWGRSLSDLVRTLEELTELGVSFVSVTEFFDLATPTGKAMAGMLSIFSAFERDMLKERIRAGIAQAKRKGRPHGRPRTALKHEQKIKRLYAEGMTKAAIARKLNIGRTSVIRILAE
jgi:DNA invertase Pin-like site-specific DNA recombinase